MRSGGSKGSQAGKVRAKSQKTLRGKLFVCAVVITSAIVITGMAVLRTQQKTTTGQSHDNFTVVPPSPKTPHTLAELLALKPEELEGVDIGLMNLLCAEGLRGSESLNVTSYFARLDGIASRVEFETRRHLYRFRNKPEEFNHSEGYFRMLFMAVTLQEDLGMTYNPERIREVGDFEPNETFFADARDVFIHGLIADDRRMGTCSSMPVLYVAVGRRLGYPLKLVPTQNHLFVRWESRGDSFNVDATGRGMNMYDDNHYRQWPMPISSEDEQTFGFLKSMKATDELTAFLGLRGHCFLAMGRMNDCVAMHEAALRYSPESRLQQLILARVKERIQPQRSLVDYLPPEQCPNWPKPRPAIVYRSDVPGVAPVVQPDPNPLNRIRN
jgi:hypothetical protein